MILLDVNTERSRSGHRSEHSGKAIWCRFCFPSRRDGLNVQADRRPERRHGDCEGSVARRSVRQDLDALIRYMINRSAAVARTDVRQ